MSKTLSILIVISAFTVATVSNSSALDEQVGIIEMADNDSPFLLERDDTLPFFTSKAAELVSIVKNRIDRTRVTLNDFETFFDSIRLRQNSIEQSFGEITQLLLDQIRGAEILMVNRANKLEEIDDEDKEFLKTNKRRSENIEKVMQLVNSEDWVCPVEGKVKFYDSWNEKRPRGLHRGVDIVGFHGANLLAPVDGTIAFFWDSVGGKSFRLIADNGDYYFGTHLYRYGSKSGKVAAGDVIGQLGAGGNATGPHLHFEFHAGPVGKGNELNPYQIAHRHCTNRIPMEMPLDHGQEEDHETFLFPYGNFEWD